MKKISNFCKSFLNLTDKYEDLLKKKEELGY